MTLHHTAMIPPQAASHCDGISFHHQINIPRWTLQDQIANTATHQMYMKTQSICHIGHQFRVFPPRTQKCTSAGHHRVRVKIGLTGHGISHSLTSCA
jgi:hypothetical protein